MDQKAAGLAASLAVGLRSFVTEKRGNVALIFAILIPVTAGLLSSVLDYQNIAATRTRIQKAADAAALASAKELQLANPDARLIAHSAKIAALANLGASDNTVKVKADVIQNNSAVSVTIATTVNSFFGKASLLRDYMVSVKSVARLSAASSLCILTLDQNQPQALGIDSAKLTAPSCAAMSNSKARDSISVTRDGRFVANGICSGGGVVAGKDAISPQAQLDCPPSSDPLGSRVAPTVWGCDYTNVTFSGGSQTLSPGTYCGGITASNATHITMQNGVYIIKDGPFKLSEGSQLVMSYAGVYLTGGATLNFDETTALNLEAPSEGLLSGILFFEDRAAPMGQVHLIGSRKAEELLGTVYLPRGKLIVGQPPTSGAVTFDCTLVVGYKASCPVTPSNIASASSWTIVIANQIALNAGVNLILNANYLHAKVPAPKEIVTNRPHLVQ